MKGSALGIIETTGRAGLIEAVDSALKTAAVTLKASYCIGGGLNTVTLIGDVAAIKAAMDAAKAVIEKMNIEGTTHVIARLADEVWNIVEDDSTQASQQSSAVISKQEIKSPLKIVPKIVSQPQKDESEPPKSAATQAVAAPQADKVNFNVNTKIAKYKAKNRKNRRRR
ncbi:MAG: BMC domain-containing protein [Elusimicrobiota bacterium]|nr:BMC domain-containing protein [Elusimicrobiota bacterium]